MKQILLFSVLSLGLICNVNAQSIEGTYANKWIAPSGESLSYELTLHFDGSFNFVATRTFSVTEEKTTSASGTWKVNNNLLVLNTHDMDKSNGLVSSLNDNKARFISISPRNPNFNLLKSSLKFFKSEVFYAKNMELLKEESSVTSAK